MTNLRIALVALATMVGANAVAQETAAKSDAKPETTKATFLITGLHCPPCAPRVESSLKGVKGVAAAKVDYQSKTASVEFDETVVSAQEITRRIAATPHVMGSSMHYGAWLALQAGSVKDAASGEVAEKALRAIEGVKTAKAYPDQRVIASFFAEKGDLTSAQIIEALSRAGVKAETYWAK